MRVLAIFIVVMIVLAFINGFDFSVYKVLDLSSYPTLEFESVVQDFSHSSASGLKSTITVLKSGSDLGLKMLEIFNHSSDTETPEGWSDQDVFYFEQLMSIESKLSEIDYVKVHMANNVLTAPDYLEDLYFKYFGTEGARGDGG